MRYRAPVRLDVGGKTLVYDIAIALVAIGVTAVIALVTAIPPVGAAIGAVLSAIIRAEWPSPRNRADAQVLRKLRGQVDYLQSPRHAIEQAQGLEKMRRWGPRWPGDR